MYSSTARVAKFSTKNGGASLRSHNEKPLEMDALRKTIPSIFAEDAHASRSERYAYIPTSEILTNLMEEGFKPFAAFQGGSRDDEKRGFTKHLIRLRHDSALDLTKGSDSVSEIVLLNSHDGTSSYRMMGGKFRIVCANGLIVSDGLMREVRVAHKGDVAHDVLEGCVEILKDMPRIDDSIREMRSIELTEAEQNVFASAALVARYGDEIPIRPAQITRPRRTADNAPDVWSTFNRIQENMIQGGVGYIHTSDNGSRSHRRTREVRGIDQNTNLNRALWQLAEQMKELKAS